MLYPVTALSSEEALQLMAIEVVVTSVTVKFKGIVGADTSSSGPSSLVAHDSIKNTAAINKRL